MERNAASARSLIVETGPGWTVPAEVRVADDRLLYRWGTERERRRVRAKPAALERFARLSRAAPDSIEGFARAWGVLGGEAATWAPGQEEAHEGWSGQRNLPWYWYQESLATWRARAGAVGAALRLAQQLNGGRRGDPQDWEAVLQVTDDVAGEHLGRMLGRPRLEWYRMMLARAPRSGPDVFSFVVSVWLHAADLTPLLTWAPPKRPTLEIRGGESVWAGVLQALVAEVIGEAARYVFCGNPTCGQIIGKTAGAGSRRVFCEDCRSERGDPGAASRVQALRERKRQVRELRNEGLSLAAIAERMDFHDTDTRSAIERVKQLLAEPGGTGQKTRRRQAPSRGK